MLAKQTLGIHPVQLFPAWHAAQRMVLAAADLAPPVAELDDPDLTARRRTYQRHIDWIMLMSSLLDGHDTVVIPAPGHTVAFSLAWRAQPSIRPVVRRLVESSLAFPPPRAGCRRSNDG